ncbi:MAG: cyclic nucleotide-binding domain-containing protein [Deltaproteobacteria bacterium]|nr:cyclic nucleotide-binding domain-containing protein [Deltaproteobacteria bacterium]
MADTHENAFPVITLKYREGDLIIKEGDYGISIYKIIKGKVLIFQEHADEEIPLATLGPGDIFGEIAFLNKAGETRSSSARAMEDVALEVWHPSMLSKEYQEMPPMLRYVADQLLARLLRMNHLLVQLTTREHKRQKAIEMSNPLASQRRYYRKTVDLACQYRPVGSSPKVCLSGRIKDMSLAGLGMEIAADNTKSFSHVDGDSFLVNTVLPNGKNLELKVKVVSLTKSETPGSLLVGMSVTDLSAGAQKSLGFFLMP